MSESSPDDPKKARRGLFGQPAPGRFGRSLMGWVVIIGLAVVLMTLMHGMDQRTEMGLSVFLGYLENDLIVGKIVLSQGKILATLSDEAEGLKENQSRKLIVHFLPSAHEDISKELRTLMGDRATLEERLPAWWEGLLPQVLFLACMFFVAFFLFRKLSTAAGGGGFLGNFGRSKHRLISKEHTKVTFDDVAGVEEAKDELKEIIAFLKDPRRFQRLGGRIPRGVLLVGEPGCGKTLLAKAIAGQAEVPFFSISGSDFVEMFVGVGASRVRDLFKQAKESSPCIIFLDEIDAVGRRRGQGFNGGGHDEREQTLNAILVEMDGFESSDQVIVIAATNRMDVLDPALTRPGRFDRQIDVPLPDVQGRYEILKIYAAKIICGPDTDLKLLARGTPMFSGADLEALVNEAAIAATMADKDAVEQADLEEARDKVRWGRSRKSHVIDDHEKKITAYHEAGHALVQLILPEADPLHKVSIIPRGTTGGATFALPEKDRYLYTRKYCEAFIHVCMAGRIAEELFCGDIDSGAASDIAQATQLARKMVMDWGMSDKLGFVKYSGDTLQPFAMDGKDYSDQTAEIIDLEIKAIMETADRRTRQLVQDNRAGVQGIAEALLKYETLNADEVQQIIDGKSLDKPTVGDLLTIEQEKAADEPAGAGEAAPPAPESQPQAGSEAPPQVE